MVKTMLKFIFCKLLKIHIYDNQMNSGLYAEGWDEFYMCKLCGQVKKTYMDEVKYETDSN